MAIPQPEQQLEKPRAKGKHKNLSQRTLVIITVILIAIAVAIIWILSSLSVIPASWAAVSSVIVAVFGAVFTFLQSLHVFFTPATHESPVVPEHAHLPSYIPATSPPSLQMLPIIVQLPTTQPLPPQSPPQEKASHRGIVGLPPPTDPRTIQQREHVVKDVYSKLTRPGITAIALTGIGGVGKSTLAALIYRYAEEQRLAHNEPFLAEALWLTVDPAVTFADLAGNLFEAIGKSLPDLSNLAPQNQAVALFNALNATEKARLVILDQFENLLDWETGHALADRPGVGEWLDIINSQPCACRVLLTSRPRPVGTREYPPTYMQEYPVSGLEVAEGVELLRNQGVQGTEAELRVGVEHCAGHAFALTLLASLVRDHSVSLSALFKDPALWIGDIATNLLDHIYMQRLSEVQRELLLAFSVYREPVPLDGAQAIITKAPKTQVTSALKALRTQHLLEAAGEGRYQLHAIIAEYALNHFDETNEQANEDALRAAHAKAAQYYLQRAAISCPPREQRRRISDIHDLIEAVWQYCQAERWQEAYDLMEQEGIFEDLKRWGGNAILLELCQLLVPSDSWHLKHPQAAEIYNDLGEVCRVLGQMERALGYLEQALRICQEERDSVREGWAHNNLGRVYYDLGNKERARECYEQALSIFKEAGDRRGEGTIFNNLGRVYDSLGWYERAQEYYERALSIDREIGDRVGEGWTLSSMGRLYNMPVPSSIQKEHALKCCKEALSIFREVGDRGKEGWALSNLGRIYNALGENTRAQECYQEALSIHREVRDRRGEGWIYSNLGKVYVDLGKNRLARDYYEQALKIYREVGDRWREGATLNNLGWVYDDLGEMERAKECYKQALSIREEVGDRWGVNRTLKNLGRVYVDLGQKKIAWRHIQQALKISKEVGDREGEAKALQTTGLLYFKQYHYDVALACFLLASNILDELHSPYLMETQRSLKILREAMGNDEFTELATQVEPQAQQIIEQALREEME